MKLLHTIRWGLAGALLAGVAPAARAQDAPVQKPAKAIEVQVEPIEVELVVSEDVEEEDTPRTAQVKRFITAKGAPAPATWLGIYSEVPADDLRSQLELDGRGLVVRQVRDESPAARAGIKLHDVLLEAGGRTLGTVEDLHKAVGEAGEKQFEIVLLRGGKKLKVSALPTKRPDNLDVEFNIEVAPAVEAETAVKKVLDALQDQVGREGKAAWQFRAFGPGVVRGGAGAGAVGAGAVGENKLFVVDGGAVGAFDLPKGVSIMITKEGSEPAKVTVKRDGKSWDATVEKLDAIPEDLRPMAARMLGGHAHGHFTYRLQEHLPGEVRDRIIKTMPGGAVPFTLPLPGGAGAVSGAVAGVRVAPPTGNVFIAKSVEQDTTGVKAELAKLREEVSQLRKEVHGRNADRETLQTLEKLLKRLVDENKK
jgi:hypothetical protein